MTGKEYRDTLETLGLGLNEGARFLGMSREVSARVANGEDRLGWPRAALLRLMVLHHVKPQDVERMMSDYDEENDE